MPSLACGRFRFWAGVDDDQLFRNVRFVNRGGHERTKTVPGLGLRFHIHFLVASDDYTSLHVLNMARGRQ